MLLLMLLLGACGTSPAVRYYSLQPVETGYQLDPADSPVLTVGPLRMPQYLDRSQMVFRGRGAEMIVDDLSRWAEPLDEAIHRVTASNVDSLLASVSVVAYPSAALLNVHYRLAGRINRFDADRGGLIVLDVQWGVGDIDGDLLVPARRSHYEKQASDPDDPGAIALAMSDVLAQFSRDIARELEARLR